MNPTPEGHEIPGQGLKARADAGPKTACLLIHGFAGSPFEMESLVPGLEKLGCTVVLPALPGHGTCIADFRRTFFPDWLEHARDHLRALRQCHEKIIPIGFSMGATIALSLAAQHDTAAVVALSPPWRAYGLFPLNRSSWLMLTPVLKYLRPEIHSRPPRPESRAIAPFKGYDGPLCLPQLHSLERGIRAMRALLPRLACPVFMMHDLHDRVCPPEAVLNIARSSSATDISLRFTRMRESLTSHHMITTHRDTRDAVAAEVTDFISRMMS